MGKYRIQSGTIDVVNACAKRAIICLFLISIHLGLSTPGFAATHEQPVESQALEGIRDTLSRIPDADLKRILIEQLDVQEKQNTITNQPDSSIKAQTESKKSLPTLHHKALNFFRFVGRSFNAIPTSIKLIVAGNQPIESKQTQQTTTSSSFTIVLSLATGLIAALMVYGLWVIIRKKCTSITKLNKPLLGGIMSPSLIKLIGQLLLLGVFSFAAKLAVAASDAGPILALKSVSYISAISTTTLIALMAHFIFSVSLSRAIPQYLDKEKARNLTLISTIIALLYSNKYGLEYFWNSDVDKTHVININTLIVTIMMSVSVLTVWHYRHIFSGWLQPHSRQGLKYSESGLVARLWPITIITLIVLQWLAFLYSSASDQANLVDNSPAYLAILLLFLFPFVDRVLRWKTHQVLNNVYSSHMLNDDDPDQQDLYNGISNILRVGLLVVLIGLICVLWEINIFEHANPQQANSLGNTLIPLALLISTCYVLWQIVSVYISRRLLKERMLRGGEEIEAGGEGGGAAGSRWETVMPILGYAAKITIALVGVFAGLTHLGVSVTPLIAGAGVLGLAIGFGSQTLVKDIVSGFFFLLDDAFRMGEFVDVGGGVTGTIEKIAIRSLRLRQVLGSIYTVPYGDIGGLTNFSRDWVIMKLRFQVPHDTDLQKIKRLFKQIGADLLEHPELGDGFIEPFKSQGALEVDDIGIVVRGKFMCLPGKQWMIRKEVYQRVQKAFAENGIEFAKRQVEVKIPDNATPEQKNQIIAGAAEAVANTPLIPNPKESLNP